MQRWMLTVYEGAEFQLKSDPTYTIQVVRVEHTLTKKKVDHTTRFWTAEPGKNEWQIHMPILSFFCKWESISNK